MSGKAWIQDPKTANTMRFHLDLKSWSAYPIYFVDAGRPLPDPQSLLKTRCHLHLKQARELWRQRQGWRQVANQWRRCRNLSAAIVA